MSETGSSQNAPHSEAYERLKAGMDAHEMWEDMTATERLPIIMNTFAVEAWFGLNALPTLAIFRYKPAGKWGAIKARFQSLKGNPWDLEKAVDQLLQAQKANEAEHIPPSKRYVVTTMSEIEPEPVDWLWWPYLAYKKLAMIDGDPGVGKSILVSQLAACLSRGYPLPDQQGKPTLPTGGPHATLLLALEDGLADTLRPRLDAAGADCTHVHVFRGYLGPEDEMHAFQFQHMEVLERAIVDIKPRLVVIDPVQGYLGPIDIHRSNQTRPLLDALARLAEQYHCAIVCVRHAAKPGEGTGKALHRGLGGIDFAGAARTVLFVEQHPTDAHKALICHAKSNAGVLGRMQVFSKAEGKFLWCGVTRINTEVLAGSGRGPNHHAFLEALCWLENRLEGGLSWPAADIEAEALELEYAKGTLRRAKQKLGVVSVKSHENNGGWTWRLPPLPTIPPPVTTCATSTSSTGSTSSTSTASSHAWNGKGPATRSTGEDVEVTEVTEVREDIEERGIESRESVDIPENSETREVFEDTPFTHGTHGIDGTNGTPTCPICGKTDWVQRPSGRECFACQYVER